MNGIEVTPPPAFAAANAGMLRDGLMVLFLIGSFNFMFGKLEGFSCETKAMLSTLWVRHAFSLAGLFVVLVVFTRSKPVVSPPALVAVAFGLYAIFLVICRCDARFLAVVLAAVVAVFYLEAMRSWDAAAAADKTKEDNVRAIANAQLALEAGVLALAATGCLVYIGQHAREYRGGKWSWFTFWLGVSACKGNASPCDKGGCSVLVDMYDGARRVVGISPERRPKPTP